MTAAAQLERGDCVDRYVIVGTVGTGASGTVYRAYDPELDRAVALKVLDASRKTAATARVQLLREGRAIAKLSHPNVVSVFDVFVHGDEGGAQVFLAMELVEGQPLDAWLDTRRSWAEIRDVFVAAGEGLAAAHGAGLVHRDFKPANVLVGRDGRPRVLDFGLARPRSRSQERNGADGPGRTGLDASFANVELTRSGTTVGTPAFMSPEARAGAATDQRGDQYAFCVALHHAIHGAWPGEDPGTPPVPGVPARAQRAIQRGLAQQPGDRFASMAALLTELQPPHKLGVRGRAVVALASALAAGLTVAAFSGNGSVPQWCAQGRGRMDALAGGDALAAIEDAFVQAAGDDGKRRFAVVAGWLAAYADRWVEVHDDVCGRARGAVAELSRTCLARHETQLRALVEVLADPDTITVEHAAQAATRLPSPSGCLDAAVLLQQPAAPEHDATRVEVERVRTGLARVQALAGAGHYQDAAVAVRPLVVAADELGYTPLLAEARYRLGRGHELLGDYEAARTELSEAYWGATASRHDALAAAAAIQLVSVTGERLGRHEAGLDRGRDARAILERGGAQGELLGRLENNVGNVLSAQGRFSAARAHLEVALALHERTHGPRHPYVAAALGNLGNAAYGLGEASAARGFYERAIEIQREAVGPDHPWLAVWQNGLGNALHALGDLDAADAAYRAALQLHRRRAGDRHPYLAAMYANLASLALTRNDCAAALTNSRLAAEIWRDSVGEDHSVASAGWLGLGNAQACLGRRAEALEALERALDIRQRNGWDAVGLAEVRFALAAVLWSERSDRDRALTLARQAQRAYALAGHGYVERGVEVASWLQGRGNYVSGAAPVAP